MALPAAPSQAVGAGLWCMVSRGLGCQFRKCGGVRLAPPTLPSTCRTRCGQLLLGFGVGGLRSLPAPSSSSCWLRGSGQAISEPQFPHLQNGIKVLHED